MTNPKLYMLVGVPGCGKSFWADKNAERLNAVILSTDAILDEWAKEKEISYSESFDRYVKDANKEMSRRVEDAIENNQNVIWDQTNTTVKSRRRKLVKFDKNYHKIAVFFDVDDECVDKRLKNRELEIGKHIPDNVMDEMRSRMVPPQIEEGFDEIWVIRN